MMHATNEIGLIDDEFLIVIHLRWTKGVVKLIGQIILLRHTCRPLVYINIIRFKAPHGPNSKGT